MNRTLLLMVTALCLIGPARAQEPPLPDLEIDARVTGKELRFEVVPNEAKVEFRGTPQRHTVWKVDRTNLPRPVKPGVTYRDWGIRLRVESTFIETEKAEPTP